MIPIFELYHIESMDQLVWNETVSEKLKDSRDKNDRTEIYNALVWSETNPEYDFKSIMNDAPTPGDLKFSNTEIYNYLLEFKVFMEHPDYGLLTDDRAPKTWEDYMN